MKLKDIRAAFSALRALLLASAAILGLVLCLTVMHGTHADHGANAAPAAATASTLAGHADAQLASTTTFSDRTAACQGPCGQEQYMMAAACGIVLLVPLMFIGAALLTETWRPTRRVNYLLKRSGAVPSLMPPSLILLSISRT